MLELFVLNPPRTAKSRDKPVKRKRRVKLRRRKRKLSKKLRLKDNSMAKARVKRRKRRKAPRKYRRNAWGGQSRDHRTASQLGWAYRRRRRRVGPKGTKGYTKRRRTRGYPSKAQVKRYVQYMGVPRLSMYRLRHSMTEAKMKRRRSRRRILSFRPKSGAFRGKRLVANRRRKQPRSRSGRFVSRKRSSRRYRDNWFVVNKPRRKRRRSRRRRSSRYNDNWFVVNKPRRRRRRASRRRRAKASRRRYRSNSYRSNPITDLPKQIIDNVKEIFSPDFLLNTALPLTAGFFGTRALTGGISGLLGIKVDGPVKAVVNMVGAAVGGSLIAYVKPEMAGSFMLGGVLGAVNDLVRGLVKDIAFVQQSPLLAETFGVSGFGLGTDEDVRRTVEHEVMRELGVGGVGDYLTAQQLSASENVSGLGSYLTTQNLSVAERVGQYPYETSGGGSTGYPRETSGMAELADVGNPMLGEFAAIS